MLNKKNIALISTLLCAVLLMVVFEKKQKTSAVRINGKVFNVEIVEKQSDLQKGLGGREAMCENCGMLFKFPDPGSYSFWMKDMKFPLDIVWIMQGRVVHIEKNVPIEPLQALAPAEKADSVLEINAGKSDESGLKNGDEVIF